MGRKSSGSRLTDKSPKLKQDNTHPSVEAANLGPENNNYLQKAEVQTERTNHTLERLEPQQANSNPYTRKKVLRKTPAKIRRSERLQNTVMTTNDRDIERLLEEITVSDSEKEDQPGQEKLLKHVLTLDEKAIDEKFKYIVQLLEEQKVTMDGFTPGAFGKASISESSGPGDLTYKGLYIDSQKKVEELIAENYQLNKKLAHVLGKIEVYEKGNHVTPEVLEKLKNTFFYSRLTKATDAAVNVTSGALKKNAAEIDLEGKTSAKRKKLDKEK